MRKILSWFTYAVIFRLLGRKHTRQVVEKYLRYAGSELTGIVNDAMGIMKWETQFRSGEVFFVETMLPLIWGPTAKGNRPVIFDVGANRGQYASLVTRQFPIANLHMFEPNPYCFAHLQQLSFTQDTHIVNHGLSSNESTSLLYIEKDNLHSEHGSLNSALLKTMHSEKDLATISVELSTLDQYCFSSQIDQIDLLKIDTEGHELEVLKGASRLLGNHSIKVIQFEFNEMNVVSRVFLKDFYDILPGFSFYRLDTDRLIPLHSYSPANEIFQFQNIVALHPSLGHD